MKHWLEALASIGPRNADVSPNGVICPLSLLLPGGSRRRQDPVILCQKIPMPWELVQLRSPTFKAGKGENPVIWQLVIRRVHKNIVTNLVDIPWVFSHSTMQQNSLKIKINGPGLR